MVSGERPKEHPEDVTDVVIVEDDDSMGEVIEHALNLRHHNFVRFRDGAAAVTALVGGSVKARVVLLDVGLPSLDGFGAVQALREAKVLQDTHVIMLTARSSEAEVLRGLGLGAAEHITKPFSIPVLLGRLSRRSPGPPHDGGGTGRPGSDCDRKHDRVGPARDHHERADRVIPCPPGTFARGRS